MKQNIALEKFSLCSECINLTLEESLMHLTEVHRWI